MTKDEQKAREQLISELAEMRQRMAELEASEIERKRAEERTQRLLDQQIAINRLALAWEEYRSLDEVYHTIYEHVRALMDAEAFIVSFYDKEEQLIRAGYVITEGTVHDIMLYPPIPLEEVGHGAQSPVIRTGQPLYVPDWRKAMARTKTEYKIAEDGTVSEGPPPRGEQDTFTNSALFVPMKIEGETIGVMQVQSHRLDAYSQEDIDLLSALANVATIAIRKTRLYEEARSRAERLAAINRIARAVGAPLRLNDLLETVYREITYVFQADAFFIALYDRETDELDFRIQVDEGIREPPRRQPLRQGLTSLVVTERKPVLIRDYEQEQNHLPSPRIWGTMKPAVSWLGVPMQISERLIGVICMQAYHPHAYGEEEQLLLSTIADQVAVAVENTRLYEETRRRGLEQETLREAAMALTTTLDRNEIIERILAQLQEVVPYDTASVQLFGACPERGQDVRSRRGGRMEIVGGRGFSNLPDLLGISFPVGDDNPNSEVIRTRAPFIVDGAPAVYKDFLREPHAQIGIRSWLGVPMLVGERLVGMIALDKHELGFYTQDHARLAEAFAAQAAIAIENSRLFQAEREQRELAEALEKAAAVVSRFLEPEEGLNHILEQVEQVVPGDTFNVMLLEDDIARSVRWRGYDHLGVAHPPTVGPLPIDQFPNLAKIAQTGKPLVILDTATDPDWISLESREWLRSYVAAPIRVRDLTVGFLNVNGTRPGQFGPADARRLEAFANHAATAIENSRLYRELLNHAEQLEQRVQERTAQLQAQYARLGAILHSATDGIVVVGAGGEILQANPVAQAWLTQTLSPEDAARLREAMQDLARQARERPETILELTGLDLELKAAPVVEEETEEPTVAVVAAHDVSHLKALDRMKSHFVSNVSHELRTPVTTIKLYAALMQRSPPEKWGKYLDALAQEADRQARLVENILQISRIDAGRLKMELHPTSLNQLTEKTIVSHQALAQERGLSLEHQLLKPKPVALVDPERMMQVLNNLVENAIHYTPEGGKVVVSTGKEKAGGRAWATVTVADTGMGIPKEELPHIFERFFRGEESRIMQISGTGLGLAIVKEIVEMHGGQVTVASPSTALRAGEEGVGTTFIVRLPLAEGHAQQDTTTAGT